MKKQLLSALALCGFLVSANAQTFTAGATGYTVDYTGADAANKSCYLNIAATSGGSNAGILTADGDLTNGGGTKTTLPDADGPLTLFSKATLAATAPAPAWFALSTTVGSGETAQCTALNFLATGAKGVDMTNNYKVAITIKADKDADLDFFLAAGAKDEWYPSANGSTYNTLASAPNNSIVKTLSATTTEKVIVIDFSENADEKAIFDAWSGKNLINMIGFRAQTAGATYEISKIQIGSDVVSSTNAAVLPSNVSYFPNPSSSNITVSNIDVASLKLMDINGVVVREASSSNVSVEGLSSGLYFLQINGYKPVKVMVK